MEEQNNFCSSNHNETQNNGRPLAHFHPDLWGDHFLNYTPPDEVRGIGYILTIINFYYFLVVALFTFTL